MYLIPASSTPLAGDGLEHYASPKPPAKNAQYTLVPGNEDACLDTDRRGRTSHKFTPCILRCLTWAQRSLWVHYLLTTTVVLGIGGATIAQVVLHNYYLFLLCFAVILITCNTFSMLPHLYNLVCILSGFGPCVCAFGFGCNATALFFTPRSMIIQGAMRLHCFYRSMIIQGAMRLHCFLPRAV